MGLDAYVPCSCYARGTTTPAPVAVEITEGRPWAIREDDDEEWAAFYRWRESACSHLHMEAARVRVGNWAMVRRLQHALDALGESCSSLRETLPATNGGLVEPAQCERLLDQVAYFRGALRRLAPRLVNAVTGAHVYDFVAAYGGAFVWSQQGTVGFDADGLWVTEPKGGARVFQARRVVAVPMEAGPGGKRGCELRDLDGGARVRCAWPHELETSYEVIHHVETAADHEDTLGALETVFRAAIEHDTCVVWC